MADVRTRWPNALTWVRYRPIGCQFEAPYTVAQSCRSTSASSASSRADFLVAALRSAPIASCHACADADCLSMICVGRRRCCQVWCRASHLSGGLSGEGRSRLGVLAHIRKPLHGLGDVQLLSDDLRARVHAGQTRCSEIGLMTEAAGMKRRAAAYLGERVARVGVERALRVGVDEGADHTVHLLAVGRRRLGPRLEALLATAAAAARLVRLETGGAARARAARGRRARVLQQRAMGAM